MEIIAAIIGLLTPLSLFFLKSMDVVKADKRDAELQAIAIEVGLEAVAKEIEESRQSRIRFVAQVRRDGWVKLYPLVFSLGLLAIGGIIVLGATFREALRTTRTLQDFGLVFVIYGVICLLTALWFLRKPWPKNKQSATGAADHKDQSAEDEVEGTARDLS